MRAGQALSIRVRMRGAIHVESHQNEHGLDPVLKLQLREANRASPNVQVKLFPVAWAMRVQRYRPDRAESRSTLEDARNALPSG